MKNFNEYINETHPEFFDEGFQDWKWPKKLALGAGLAGAAIGGGIGLSSGGNNQNYDAQIQKMYKLEPVQIQIMKTKMPDQYQNLINGMKAALQANKISRNLDKNVGQMQNIQQGVGNVLDKSLGINQ